MNGVDYAIIAVAAAGAIGGLLKGALGNLMAAAGIGVGIFLGMRYSDELTSALERLIPHWSYTHALAFGIILLVTFLLFRFAGLQLERLMRGMGLGGVNRLIGAGTGALMGALIALGMITALDHLMDHRMKGPIERSRIARQLSPVMRKITGLKEELKRP